MGRKNLRKEVKSVAISVCVTIIISFLFYDSMYPLLFFGGIYFFVRKVIRKEEEKKKKLILKGEFRAMILSMAAALEGGTSVEKAIEPVRNEMKMLFGEDSKIVKEINQMIKKVEANCPIEKAFDEMAFEIGLEEALIFSESFKIGKRIGGDMNQMLMNVVEIISERIQTEKEIENILAGKKYEFRIMCMAPFVIIGYVKLTSPGYFDVLYHNAMGVCVMTAVIFLIFGAYEIGKRLISIEI